MTLPDALPWVWHDAPLGRWTTLGVGGRTWGLATFENADDLRRLIAYAQRARRPWRVLGAGSNVVVSDSGYDGLVLRSRNRVLTVRDRVVRAGAGLEWDHVVRCAVKHGLSGIEALSGIPGSVGAAPFQNIGAYGQELSDTLVSVDVLDEEGCVRRVPAPDLGLAYRSSILKRGTRWVVLSIELELSRSTPEPRYRELRDAVPSLSVDRGRALRQIRKAVLRIRRQKSMVWDPADPNHRSVGSFFLNPILSDSALGALTRRCNEMRFPSPPHYRGDTGVKVSAAWLIERSGLSKGFCWGEAGLSTRHSLAIVNRRGFATSHEIRSLAEHVRSTVGHHFDVKLEPEPQLIGETWT
ncbi:MAG: UDP-N-acetylmuramate dehydrogenase [Myxococcota bacterium]